MSNFRLIFALSLLGVALALGTALSHYRQQAQRWQKEAERTTELTRQQATELVRVGNLQRDLASLDQRHTEKLNAAEQENSALRAELASGSRRMHIAGTCPSTGSNGTPTSTGRVGHDAAVELSAATGQRILSVREGIISDRQKLIYLQEYIRSVCLK